MPKKFTYPYCYQPHKSAVMAAELVQSYLADKEEWQAELQKGKMFGVLVVQKEQDNEVKLGFIAAYSGLLGGRNDWDFFVPPVFDSQDFNGHFKTNERRISALSRAGRQTRQYSINLQRWLFAQYNIMNGVGEMRNILDVFREFYADSKAYERKANGVPPSGTGDCCAPKLLQYAYLNGLKPVSMAEFWYGDSPKGEIRHHLQYYPACSGKCKPLLSHMLKGLDVEPNPQEKTIKGELKIIYEDDYLMAVNKPAGMPSVPGKVDLPDVVTLLCRENYLKPIHRLDMPTSGLLLLAKNEQVFKTMQSMFARRAVKKEYVAIVCPTSPPQPSPQVEGDLKIASPLIYKSNFLSPSPCGEGWGGEMGYVPCIISLPLSPDILNRPYQRVDYENGKEAVTEVRLSHEKQGILDGTLRLILSPLTGRTHQLRVHCAHPDGLNAPIVGDELYGKLADRLYLHCQRLEFIHPILNKEIKLYCPSDF